MGFTGFFFVESLLGFRGFYWVFLGFNGLHWVSLNCYRHTAFYRVLLGFIGFLLGFTGFYWVILGF